MGQHDQESELGPLLVRSLAPLTHLLALLPHSLACSLRSLPRLWESDLLDGYFVCVFFLFSTIVECMLAGLVPNTQKGEKNTRVNKYLFIAFKKEDRSFKSSIIKDSKKSPDDFGSQTKSRRILRSWAKGVCFSGVCVRACACACACVIARATSTT